MGLCSCADGWICRFAVIMQVCGYATRRRRCIGHVALWFPAVQHRAEALLFLHPMPVGMGYRFHGSRRIMRYQDGSRVLEIEFGQPHVFP